jgi:hypothetical protein
MLVIAAGIISTSLAQPDLLDLPIRHLLKNELRVSESQMAMLFAVGSAACCLFVFLLPRNLSGHREGKL